MRGVSVRIGVTEIAETEWNIDIDTSSMSDDEEDKLYSEISCQCCCDDIDALTDVLDEMQVSYEKCEDSKHYRIEMGRY